MDELRRIRHLRGMSQEDLAKASGVSDFTISELEGGKRPNPRPSTLRKLADALGVDVATLYGEEVPSPKAPEPLSLQWARTASDAEFYRRLFAASVEDTDRLDKLSGELHRFISRPVRRILTERNNKAFEDQGPEPNRDEYDRMKERFDALYTKVNRRRPTFAVITWRGVGPAEVRWLIPEDEREALRPKIEETLKGEDYIEIGPGDPATTERPPERSMALA